MARYARVLSQALLQNSALGDTLRSRCTAVSFTETLLARVALPLPPHRVMAFRAAMRDSNWAKSDE